MGGLIESIHVPADLVEPLTPSNIKKGKVVSELRKNWANLRIALDKQPGCLIGLRLNAMVHKSGLFYRGQRGVVTDVQILPKKIYIFITWDNIAQEGDWALPPQRIVKFNAKKMWQYVEPLTGSRPSTRKLSQVMQVASSTMSAGRCKSKKVPSTAF